VPIGFLSCALLVVNNLRDIPTDREAGKRTLAVRLGDRRTRVLYAVLVGGAFVFAVVLSAWRWGALFGLLALPLAVTVGIVVRGARGRELIPVLAATGRLQLVFGVLLAAGLWVTA
jgi:1,4-dihydroxy-2-naphthoate polyprenyltransferase